LHFLEGIGADGARGKEYNQGEQGQSHQNQPELPVENVVCLAHRDLLKIARLRALWL
jgi:hypothetical protein